MKQSTDESTDESNNNKSAKKPVDHHLMVARIVDLLIRTDPSTAGELNNFLKRLNNADARIILNIAHTAALVAHRTGITP